MNWKSSCLAVDRWGTQFIKTPDSVNILGSCGDLKSSYTCTKFKCIPNKTVNCVLNKNNSGGHYANPVRYNNEYTRTRIEKNKTIAWCWGRIWLRFVFYGNSQISLSCFDHEQWWIFHIFLKLGSAHSNLGVPWQTSDARIWTQVGLCHHHLWTLCTWFRSGIN